MPETFDLLVCLAAGFFLFFLVYTFLRLRSGKLQIGSILLIIFITCFFLFSPYYWKNSAGTEFSVLKYLSRTLFYCLKALTGNQEINQLEAFSGITNDSLRRLYLVLNYLILVIAPFLTSSLLISMIGDWADRIRYRVRLNRNYHVFSELNENSLHLARQIRSRHRWDAIVFCQTKSCSSTLLAQTKELGAIHLYASCSALVIPPLRNVFQFYLISTDEDRNLHDTEQLICRHRKKVSKPILINAFAESGTGIQVVESMKAENIHVRFIDSTAMLCNNLLLRHPLYAGLQDRRLISVAIIGCDKTGIRMLKTIAWFGQIDGYRLKIRVYDKNAEAVRQRFLAQCPELKQSCDIDFITANTNSVDFEQQILEHSSDATYIITAMGDDEQNIDVAVRLFQLFRVHHHYDAWSPKILARTRSSVKSELYISQDNTFLQERNIYLFGRTDEAYSRNALFYSDLERLSFAMHLCYKGQLPTVMDDQALLEHLNSKAVRQSRTEFLQSEYNRRSSMATALHIPAKLLICGLVCKADSAPTIDDAEQFRLALEKDPGLVSQLARNEHQRWNCFMRSEGYCQVGFEDVKRFYPQSRRNRDDRSKRHLCITDWDELEPLFAQYNDLLKQHNQPVLPEDENFQQTDKNIIRNIPDIIRFANRLKETDLDQAVFLRDDPLYLAFLSCKFHIANRLKEHTGEEAGT